MGTNMELLNRDRLSQTEAVSEHALSDEAIQAIAAVIADFINTKNSDLARLFAYPMRQTPTNNLRPTSPHRK